MGKNMRQDSSNMQLQNGNSGKMTKIMHALNRRHRWHNVRKELPNKRQGSGKHIIDGEPSEPTASAKTAQPPEAHRHPKKKNSKVEPAGEESSSVSKSSKKFRIKSLISDEMSKRRGKQQQKKSSSTNKQTKSTENGPSEKPQSNGEINPSTTKKRKCDICAAMLTVSYLRQKGFANEHQKPVGIEENKGKMQQKFVKDSASHLHPRIGPARSYSFPQLATTKRRDFEVEELKHKLRGCKDLETTKEKFIKPMNQWMDTGFPKPMLTRPASFKSPSKSAQKENKPTNQSKSLRQKIGLAMKDNKKEKKKMILMDAVFHKIPYGRKSSKDPKTTKPDKIKSSSTGSSRMDQSSVDKAQLKKTSSSAEAMKKYRWLLHHTPTQKKTSSSAEKCQHNDKPKLCVAEANSGGVNERKMLKRICSSPNISRFDFTDNQEFPVKKDMDINLRKGGTMFDDQISPDFSVFAGKKNVSTAAKESVAKGSKLADKDHEGVNEKVGVGRNTSDHQEKFDPSAASKTADKENLGVGRNTSDHQEKFDHQKEPSSAIKTAAKETKLADKDEKVEENVGVGLNTSDHQEKFDHQNETSSVVKTAANESRLVDKDEAFDENYGGGLNTSNHQENIDHQKVSGAEETKLVDKNEAVDGNTSDHQEKVDHQKESSSDNESAAKESKLVEKDHEVVDQENLGAGVNTSEEKNEDQKESSVVIETKKDKSFNEILGMFQTTVSAHQEKQGHKNESGVDVGKVAKDKAVNKDEGVDKNLEDCQDTLNHQEDEEEDEEEEEEEEKSTLNSGSEVELSMQDSVHEHDSSSLIDTPNSPPDSTSEDFSDENQLFSINDQASNVHQPFIDNKPPNNDHLFSITDQASTCHQPSIDNKRLNNDHLLSITDQASTGDQPSIDHKRCNNDHLFSIQASTGHQPSIGNRRPNNDRQKIGNGFLHLDLESVKDNAEFHYVKEVLKRSGFLENELLGEWYSSYQPIDPSLFEEVETSYLQTKNLEELESMKDEETAQKIINEQHLLLFDLINEALLDVHSKTFTYCPQPLTYCSKIRPMPVGCRVLEEVWDFVNMHLSWKPENNPSLDDAVSHDLAKGGGWMNLQADAEFVGIELEEMLADDLLDELVFDDLLM